MGIFFPDNKKRHARVVELSTDAHTSLSSAREHYADFTTLLPRANASIAALYRQAALQEPGKTPLDLLRAQSTLHDLGTADTVVHLSKLLIDLGGVALYGEMAPAAAAALAESGVLAEETAGAVLLSALGVEVTIGALAGAACAALAIGLVVAAVGFVIDAIEGSVERDHLRAAIRDLDAVRARARLAADKADAVVGVLRAVITACDVLARSQIALTDEVIQTLIAKDVTPSLRAVAQVDAESVRAALAHLDASRGSWTTEDAAFGSLKIPTAPPIFVHVNTRRLKSALPVLPAGLKTSTDTNSDTMPIVRVERVTFWPLSFIDNRMDMALVGFDARARHVITRHAHGARYIDYIRQDVRSSDVQLVGQAGHVATVKWTVLSDVTVDAATPMPWRLAPSVPDGLKLTTDPDSYTGPADTYPVLLVGRLRVWPLSFIDNRMAMALVGFDDAGVARVSVVCRGARYIGRIEEHVGSRTFTFIGQAGHLVSVSAAELAP